MLWLGPAVKYLWVMLVGVVCAVWVLVGCLFTYSTCILYGVSEGVLDLMSRADCVVCVSCAER